MQAGDLVQTYGFDENLVYGIIVDLSSDYRFATVLWEFGVSGMVFSSCLEVISEAR